MQDEHGHSGVKMYNKKRYTLAICAIAVALMIGIVYVDQSSNESVATNENYTATTLNGGDSVQLTYSSGTTLTISGTNTISITTLNSSSFYNGIYCSGSLTLTGSNSSGCILNIVVSPSLDASYLSDTFGITVNGSLTIRNCTVNIFVGDGSVGNRAIYVYNGDTIIENSILNIAGSEKAIRTGVTGDDLTITDSDVTATSGTDDNNAGTDDSVVIKSAGIISISRSTLDLSTSASSINAANGGAVLAAGSSLNSGGSITIDEVSLTGSTYTDAAITYNCINVSKFTASSVGGSYILCSEVSNQFGLNQALNSGVNVVRLRNGIEMNAVADSTHASGVYLLSEKTVTLDLNGCLLSSGLNYNIENYGTLTVIDSRGSGQISSTNSGSGCAICNRGILTLQKCIITSTVYGVYVASSGI